MPIQPLTDQEFEAALAAADAEVAESVRVLNEIQALRLAVRHFSGAPIDESLTSIPPKSS